MKSPRSDRKYLFNFGASGRPNAILCVTAKHGVTGMTKAAALGYAAQGIRINSIHPEYIDTPLLDPLPKEAYEGAVALNPNMSLMGLTRPIDLKFLD